MMNWKWQRSFALLALFAGAFLLTADFAEARRGGGRSAGVSRSGPAASGSVRSNRGETRREVRSEHHDKKRDVREGHREAKQDIHEERRDTRQDVRREVYDDRRDFREDVYRDRRRVRAARALTVTAFNNLSCHAEIIIVDHETYYRCGSNWFQKAYYDGNITYVIVTAPKGY
jgi:hypothetical protein